MTEEEVREEQQEGARHDPKKELEGGEIEESAIDADIMEEETVDYGAIESHGSSSDSHQPGLGGDVSSSSSLSDSSQLLVKGIPDKPPASSEKVPPKPVLTFVSTSDEHENQLQCQHCERWYSAARLAAHKERGCAKCPKCHRWMSDKATAIHAQFGCSQLRQPSDIPGGRVTCRFCGDSFLSAATRGKHEVSCSVKCDDCGVLVARRRMEEHQLRLHGIEPPSSTPPQSPPLAPRWSGLLEDYTAGRCTTCERVVPNLAVHKPKCVRCGLCGLAMLLFVLPQHQRKCPGIVPPAPPPPISWNISPTSSSGDAQTSPLPPPLIKPRAVRYQLMPVPPTPFETPGVNVSMSAITPVPELMFRTMMDQLAAAPPTSLTRGMGGESFERTPMPVSIHEELPITRVDAMEVVEVEKEANPAPLPPPVAPIKPTPQTRVIPKQQSQFPKSKRQGRPLKALYTDTFKCLQCARNFTKTGLAYHMKHRVCDRGMWSLKFGLRNEPRDKPPPPTPLVVDVGDDDDSFDASYKALMQDKEVAAVLSSLASPIPELPHNPGSGGEVVAALKSGDPYILVSTEDPDLSITLPVYIVQEQYYFLRADILNGCIRLLKDPTIRSFCDSSLPPVLHNLINKVKLPACEVGITVANPQRMAIQGIEPARCYFSAVYIFFSHGKKSTWTTAGKKSTGTATDDKEKEEESSSSSHESDSESDSSSSDSTDDHHNTPKTRVMETHDHCELPNGTSIHAYLRGEQLYVPVYAILQQVSQSLGLLPGKSRESFRQTLTPGIRRLLEDNVTKAPSFGLPGREGTPYLRTTKAACFYFEKVQARWAAQLSTKGRKRMRDSSDEEEEDSSSSSSATLATPVSSSPAQPFSLRRKRPPNPGSVVGVVASVPEQQQQQWSCPVCNLKLLGYCMIGLHMQQAHGNTMENQALWHSSWKPEACTLNQPCRCCVWCNSHREAPRWPYMDELVRGTASLDERPLKRARLDSV